MEIIVFTTEGCSYCQTQKEYMLKNGIDFKEVDVGKDEKGFKEFREAGGIGTPFTIKKVNQEIVYKVIGFNEKKLSHELLT